MLRWVATLIVAFFIVGCGGGSDSSNGSSVAYKSATIGHNGYDFSKDDNNASWENQDGYTIAWTNNGMKYSEGESWGSAVWFGVNAQDDQSKHLFMYDAGEVSLDSISSVDESKWQNIGDAEKSLQVNHVYVLKALDGYVKLKVISVNSTTEIHEVSFDAQYQYSTTTAF